MKVFSLFRKVVKRFSVIIKDVKEKFPVFIKWLIWDFLGAHFIWVKIKPPPKEITDNKNYKPPTSFFIWVVGIYVAFFGLASQRYENRIDIIENRANAIFAQLSTKASKKALGRISRVQNMSCPYKPDILKPSTVFFSLFRNTIYTEMIEQLRETVEDWKESLDKVNFQDANLAGANLAGANLLRANLAGVLLYKANLAGANLNKAFFEGSFLYGANLLEAELWMTDLRGVKSLDIDQLCQVKTLFEAQMDEQVKEQIEKKCPHLLEKSSLER